MKLNVYLLNALVNPHDLILCSICSERLIPTIIIYEIKTQKIPVFLLLATKLFKIVGILIRITLILVAHHYFI